MSSTPAWKRRGAALLLVAFAACATPGQHPGTRRVVIVNEHGVQLRLCRAQRDDWGPATVLGNAQQLTLDLLPGRYALQLGDAPSHRVPLPLPTDELGFVAPGESWVTIEPWPADEPGWCWIPAGIALRGDELGVGQEDERPLSTPDTPGFWLAQHETSNAQFAVFLNALGRDAIDERWLDLDGAKCRVQWDDASGAFVTDAPTLPVVTVSWAGAVAYCDWLTRTSGKPHRLPSETEWEKAARGPGSRVYAYGDTCTTGAANQESGRLRVCGAFAPNGFGLYDMTGNAFEWTADVYRRNAYGPHPSGTDDHEQREFRALRGGSFVLDGIFCRNSMRMRLRPDVRADDIGFRVLREQRPRTD